MSEVLKEALLRVDKGEIIAVITITDTKGSTPGAKGAKMAVGKDGIISGTIGGGKLEAQIIETAQKCIQSGKKRSIHYHLNKEESELENEVICGGELTIFIDILKPNENIIIFGAGHIAFYLAKIAKIIGIHVSIIDERENFANQARFPEADTIINKKPDIAFKKLNINASTYVVIITKGHHYDEEALFSVIHSDSGYIGMIGSKAKNRIIFQNLIERGVKEQYLSKVHAPIGIDIGALTPEEIAVSIIAEIIQVKRGKKFNSKSA